MAVSLNGLRSFFSQYTQFSLWSATTFVVAFFLWLKRWLGGGVCTHVADLRGRNVVITGANAGIGRAAAISLARMGATLILACRTRKTAEETVEEIKRTTGNSNVSIVDLDLASFASVQRCAVEIGKRFANIDILINNAGLMDVPHTVTEDGFELQFEANHLGHFLLTHLLLPRLQKAPAARIVNVASNSHVFAAGIDWEQVTGRSNAKYSRRGAYSQSKLANILFTYCSALLSELARRLRAANSPITTYTLHPGVVATEILRHWPALLRLLVAPVMACVKTPLQGAQTTIFCAIAPGIENLSGGYFADCKVRKPSKAGSDEAAAKTLFDRSEEFIGGARFELPPDASAYVVPQAKKQK